MSTEKLQQIIQLSNVWQTPQILQGLWGTVHPKLWIFPGTIRFSGQNVDRFPYNFLLPGQMSSTLGLLNKYRSDCWDFWWFKKLIRIFAYLFMILLTQSWQIFPRFLSFVQQSHFRDQMNCTSGWQYTCRKCSRGRQCAQHLFGKLGFFIEKYFWRILGGFGEYLGEHLGVFRGFKKSSQED